MQGRSLSKQHKPSQLLATAQQDQQFASNTARKYPRDQMAGSANHHTAYKIKSPIKTLQVKHKNLEMQLSKLQAEMAYKHQSNAEEHAQKRRYSRQGFGTANQQLNFDQKLGLNQSNNRLRLISKDRSLSGSRRIAGHYNHKARDQAASASAFRIMSPVLNSSKAPSQGTSSRQEKKKQLKEIIGNAKKNNPSLKLKLANKGPKISCSSGQFGSVSTLLMGSAKNQDSNRKKSSVAKNYYAQTIENQSNVPMVDDRIEQSGKTSSHANNFDKSSGTAWTPKQQNYDADRNSQKLLVLPMSSDDDLKRLIQTPTHLPETDPSMGDFDSIVSPDPAQKLMNAPQQSQSYNKMLTQNMRNGGGEIPRQFFHPTDAYEIRNENAAFNFKNILSENSTLNEMTLTNNTGGSQFLPINNNSDLVKGLETGILSLHCHLKSLEGKYIDLANYYKQELVATNQQESLHSQSSRKGGQKVALKRSDSRESSQLYPRRQQAEVRSLSKGSKNVATEERLRTKRQGYNAALEKGIIEEVKLQKQKLEGEMRNLIGLYTQISDEDQNDNIFKNLQHAKRSENPLKTTTLLNQILTKQQNKLLALAESDQRFEKCIEHTFDELFDELSQLFAGTPAQGQEPGNSDKLTALQQFKLPPLPLMERLEKLGGDYDIQQEYSLSNLKETMFQLQHCNDQLQLDLKRIGLDFDQIEKRLHEKERSSRTRQSDSQDSLATLTERASSGLKVLANRLSLNEQKLKVMAENHGESVRYLRQYRENVKKVSGEYPQQFSTMLSGGNSNLAKGETSADQTNVSQSQEGRSPQAEITSLSQEIFELRTQLAEAKQHGLLDLNGLRGQLELLNTENETLHDKITSLNEEMAERNTQIVIFDRQNADLASKLQSAKQTPNFENIQAAQALDDAWRQTCQELVTLCHKFLLSMRKLQKVVHRKESNVQQEKQGFEATKKELEVKLRDVKGQLDSKPAQQRLSQATTLQEHTFGHNLSGRESDSNRPSNYSQKLGQQLFTVNSASSNPESPQTQIHKQGTEGSYVPHKESQAAAIAELEVENSQVGKKLQKERQKNQTLLNELKMSQDNLSKLRSTSVPPESIIELEARAKQLQETIDQQQAEENGQTIQLEELKSTISTQQFQLQQLVQKQIADKPDLSEVLSAITAQINDTVKRQASWVQSTAKHLKEKERQVVQLIDTVRVVSQQMTGKNEQIQAFLQEIALQDSHIRDQAQELSSLQFQQSENQALAQGQADLQEEIQRLQGELKVKKAGSTMLNALMRAIKQKLLSELQLAKQQLDEKSGEVKKISQDHASESRTFQARLEKKKLKSTQTKTLIAQQDQELQVLKSRVGDSQMERDTLVDALQNERDQALSRLAKETSSLKENHAKKEAELKGQNTELQSNLNVKTNGNRMMNALMRGIKQKLLSELQLTKQQLDEKSGEVKKISQDHASESRTFQARIEKKKLKSTQTKTLIAQKDQELQVLKSRVGDSQMERDTLVNALQNERDEALSRLTKETSSLKQDLSRFSKEASQLKESHTKKEAELKGQNTELQSNLNVRTNGNRMMNALMQAFKQKIIDEKCRQDAIIAQQKTELSSATQQVHVQGEQVKVLKAKIEKKKFKQGQTKVLIAKVEQEQQAIHGAKRQVEEKLATKENDLDTVSAQKQETEEQVRRLQDQVTQLQVDHDLEICQIRDECASSESKVGMLEKQKEELRVVMSEQLDSLTESEKAKELKLGETIKQLRKDTDSKTADLKKAEASISKLEGTIKKLVAEGKTTEKRHRQDLEETRETIKQQALELATIEQLEAAKNQSVMYVISQLRIEVEDQTKINQERDVQATEYNNKLTESTLFALQLQNQLESAMQDAKVEKESLENEIVTMQTSLNSAEEKLSALKAELNSAQAEQRQTESSLSEKTTEVVSLTEKIETIESQNFDFKKEQEQIQSDLRQGRDAAQAQLTDFINQNKFEKESLEEKLQSQLNQTLAQLNVREDECEATQKNLNELKEANGKLTIQVQDLTVRLEEKEASLQQTKASLESSSTTKKENQAALEQNRDLILQFKAELQKSLDSEKAKDEEIVTLRAKVETMTTDLAARDNQITEHEDDLNTLRGELEAKSGEVTRALNQSDAFKEEIDRLSADNTTFRDQIASLKQEFQAKAAELNGQIDAELQTIKEKDELISEADGLLAEFNTEKHEVKAKFKHLMQIVSLRATSESNLSNDDEDASESKDIAAASSYKGRDGEVDLNHCFSELEQIVLDFKTKQESRIVELLSDKEQLVETVQVQKQDLEAMQASLTSLQEKIDSANQNVEQNDQEARRQIDTAMRKIQNYKDELESKKAAMAALDAQVMSLTQEMEQAKAGQSQKLVDSDSGLDNSYFEMQKENRQLLLRLQKTEQALSKVRSGEDEDPVEAPPQAKTITLSPEVAEKLEDISERMAEIKRDLHHAKSTCLKDLMTKYAQKLKDAQMTFVKAELLDKAIDGDKLSGWNNIVKECKMMTYCDQHFVLVELTDQKTYHLVNLDQVTETTAKYLKAFVEDYDDEDFVQDAIGQDVTEMDEEPEIEKLKALITDLRQDRIELQAELEQFRDNGKGDVSRLAALKEEEMKDDLEYLTGENKDLHLKVKEVCISRASLQMELAKARKQLAMQKNMSVDIDQENDEMLPIDASEIVPAKNINLGDDIFAPVEEMQEESSRMPDSQGAKDCLSSDNDSIIDAVNQIDEEEENIRVSDPINQIKRVKATLRRAESQNEELKTHILTLETQIKSAEQNQTNDISMDENPLEHIKGILSQYLRNVPFVDKQHEDLLNVIFNMLNYTETEIQELKIARMNIKLLAKGKPQRSNSRSITGNSNSSLSREDGGVDSQAAKQKRGGFLGIFGGKKNNNQSSSQNLSAAGRSGSHQPVPKR